MKLTIKYFAALREKANKSEEIIEGDFKSASELYDHVNELYSLDMSKCHLQVAINEEYQEFESILNDGDTVVFIPPVAGG